MLLQKTYKAKKQEILSEKEGFEKFATRQKVLQMTFVGKTKVAAICKNQMIDERDVQQIACLFEFFGQFYV